MSARTKNEAPKTFRVRDNLLVKKAVADVVAVTREMDGTTMEYTVHMNGGNAHPISEKVYQMLSAVLYGKK